MKHYKLIFILLLFLSLSIKNAEAQRVVIDKKSIEQVMSNSTAMIANESLITQQLKEIKKEQDKVLAVASIMERNIALIEKTQKDISAFRQEGAAVKLFVAKFQRTIKAAEEVVKVAFGDKGDKLIGLAASFKLMQQLSEDIYGIGNNMIRVVCNSRISIPGIPPKKGETNLIEPQERLALYNNLIFQLDIIYYKLLQMQMSIIGSNTIDQALLKISPITFTNKQYGKYIAQDIVDLWKK